MREQNVAGGVRGEQDVALRKPVRAALEGDGAAACRLGDMYREGLRGLRYSPKQTYHWYARSAMAGSAKGQCNLGACYEHGIGCVQSYPNAVKWYRRSVAQGNATAYMNLGYCYLNGRGVPRDAAEALRLFRAAVEGGEDRAAQEVERLQGSRGPRALNNDAAREQPQVSTDRPRPRVWFVDRTKPGRHLAMVGVSSVAPPRSVPEATK